MTAPVPVDPTLLASISRRATAAGLRTPLHALEDCARYVDLLGRWNRRINLTALPLDSPVPDAALDKLIVEPLCAASFFLPSDQVWVDLGSGGGSPAIPLKLVIGTPHLTMVESRGRKCSFLREAVRALSLPDTTVLESRFEQLDSIRLSSVDVVTLRAVRIDGALLELLVRLLVRGGRVFMFGGSVPPDKSFSLQSELALPDGSLLRILQRL